MRRRTSTSSIAHTSTTITPDTRTMAEHTQGAEFPNLGGGFLEPAFPVSTVDGFTQFGMTLRDYFAAQAVVASLARLENDRNLSGYGFSAVAEGAYAIAD